MVARRFMARGSKEVFFLEPIELSPAAILAKFLPVWVEASRRWRVVV